MNYNRADLLDRLASEYVLGTLHGAARRRFDKLLIESPAARAAVRAWEQRLALLAAPVPPVAPPSRVWSATEARIASTAASTAAGRGPQRLWWSSLWKPALGFAFGAALTFALVQLMPGAFVSLDGLAQREQALPQSYVGLLQDSEGLPTLLISSTRHGTRVTVKSLRPVVVPAGKVAQVWALPKEGAPFPIGVAVPTKPHGGTAFEMSATSEKLLSTVTRLAVSFEGVPAQAGATPGDFILIGPCLKLW
ncbi:MAG: anti-sigma factor [Pseudomonadota bacterium]|nr:anti-sigma factor [Burkholderiaceae bacterium]MDQ3445358.1 anti-sigma factor [Pseudomonadota bacterium]